MTELEAQVQQLERTIKRAMKTLPPGEHLHVASIIFEQNAEIVRLKRMVKRRTASITSLKRMKFRTF